MMDFFTLYYKGRDHKWTPSETYIRFHRWGSLGQAAIDCETLADAQADFRGAQGDQRAYPGFHSGNPTVSQNVVYFCAWSIIGS